MKLSVRFSDQPQRWAAAPAVFFTLAGLISLIVSDTVNNKVISRAVTDVQSSVREGESIAKPLSKHAVFPPMVVQMIAVGEETGQVDTMLEKIAQFYDQEVEAAVDALTSLIEPILIAFIGGAVGAAVVALYLPMFQVIEKLQ